MPHKAFITNVGEKTLKKRLSELIEHSGTLKFLVGFFYFSGWGELYKTLKGRDDIQIRVLVGLDVDRRLFRTMEIARQTKELSSDEKADLFFESLLTALNSEQMDVEEFYQQVAFFVHLIEQDKLIIRKTAEPNHAKLYVFKIKEHLSGIADCKFITGSSNLTRAGIKEQNEFNVEIGDYGTDKAEEYFDKLWETAVPITEEPQRKKDLINLIQNRSQAADVTPFEAYVKVLKTYIDLQEQKQIKPHVQRLLEKKGYKSYSYQRDAVNQALTVLENYNGVIIADVVGLGKSVIASMIARNLGKRGMVICPPGLIGDKKFRSGWKKYLHDFQLYDWEIYSCGDLETVSEYMHDYGDDVEVVIIDEAHRFRNQDTQSNELLNLICRGRQVMLLTATPFCNSPADIFSLLKFFIVPGKSKITLDENLEARFSFYESLFRRLSYIRKNHDSPDDDKRARAELYYEQLFDELPIDLANVQQMTRHLSAQIRSVLEPIMIRRNRLDLKKDPVYKSEIKELSETKDPVEWFFELTPEQSSFYDSVINEYFGEYGSFTGAIYQPFSYEKEIDIDKLDEESNRAFQQQRNLYDFMRRLLVKRFESSFGAFSQSIDNFIRVHECVQGFIKKSKGKYILDRNLIEKLYVENEEAIEQALLEFAQKLEEEKTPKNDRVYDINKFKHKNDFLNNIQNDIDLLCSIQKQVDALKLVQNDPKSKKLVKEIRAIVNGTPAKGEPKRKVIIFTEYVDTVKHLKPVLEAHFPDRTFSVEGSLTATQSGHLLDNFDASIKRKQQQDDFDILLTSDKLSEGVNLNRAGAVINYDIPWNPTKVIQRVGRINRIGQKVFDELYIFNFFPTESGADVVKSRMIASQKMYLIHNTLGEDSKIFDVDETPTPSELFKRVNQNPDDLGDENLLTKIRTNYLAIKNKYPEVIERVFNLPPRIKTAKTSQDYRLIVFRRKALGLFIHAAVDAKDNTEVKDILFDDSLQLIECEYDEPKRSLSEKFWVNYEKIKGYKKIYKASKNEVSLEVKAMNNLQSSIRFYKSELHDKLPFIRMLIKDLRDYHTLSKYSLRRLSSFDLKPDKPNELKKFEKEVQYLLHKLGENYLNVIKKRIADNYHEIIIAVENLGN
jgi:SNF2 family DNA or RNA helicase